MNRFYQVIIIVLLVLSILCFTANILFLHDYTFGIRILNEYSFGHFVFGMVLAAVLFFSCIFNFVNYVTKAPVLRIIVIILNVIPAVAIGLLALDSEGVFIYLILLPLVLVLIGSIGCKWTAAGRPGSSAQP